jgi:hypothetical protein
MGLADAIGGVISLILGMQQTGPPEFDWDDRPIDDSGKQVEDGDRIMLAAKRAGKPGYIGYMEKEGGQWAKFYEVSGDDTFDPQKAIVFTVRKSDHHRIALEAEVGGQIKTLTNNGDWVNFFPNTAKGAYKCVSTGWQGSDQGYAMYFESRREHKGDHGQVYDDDGEGGLTHKQAWLLHIVPMKYKPPPGKFGWQDRPKNDGGVQVEDGDKVWLKTELDQTVQETENLPMGIHIPTGKSHVEHETGFVCDYKPFDLHLAEFGYSDGQKVIFTVRKTKENNVALECTIGGQLMQLASVPEKGYIRVAMIANALWLDASTGRETTEKGYRLYFQAHQKTAVHRVGTLQIMEEGELVYFTIMR